MATATAAITFVRSPNGSTKKLRIIESKSVLVRTLGAASSAKRQVLEYPVCTEMARHAQ
jgi:hypothetical protein